VGNSASSGPDDQIQRLKSDLAIADDPDKDLTSLQEAHMDGSCNWLLSRKYFEDWRDSDLSSLTFLWLRGKPGVGKSVLSANIISHFRKQNLNPAFHFFKHGDKVKATIGSLLRSIAFQMAVMYPAVKARLTRMQQENIIFDVDDEGVIWRKLLLECIFKVKLKSPLFWIIDALDECSNTNAFFSLVSKRDCPVPIRVLVTSRPSGTFLKKFTDLGNATGVRAEDISTEDTLEDIRQYVTFKSKGLWVDDETDRQDVESQILAKSNGSFLWVKLVMSQLSEAHTIEEIQSLVQETPQVMEDLYRDVLTSISTSLSTSPQPLALAIAIFTWTACATRPFTVDELQTALKMDMDKKFLSLRTSISSLCGQMIYIDKHDRVQMIHETARQFILKRSESILGIEEKRCHARLAEVCLSYLAGPEMASAQGWKRSSATSLTPRSTFAEYASLSFFEHVRGTNSWNHKVLKLLHDFLTTNVQAWIEFIARIGNLQHLIKAAKNFRNFLDRRAKHHPPIGKEVQVLEQWSTDLIRLVAKFGKNLLLAPASIYGLIPPFCPRDSALGQQFGSSMRGMSVVGLSASDWDDRLSVMQYAKDARSTTVAYGPRHFAVGLSIGEIIVYNATTCQESIKYQLGQKVRFLAFGSKDNLLAASGRTEIRIWDTESGVLLHSYQTSNETLALAFSEADTRLMTATRGHTVVVYDLGYESKPDIHPWLDDEEEMDDTEFRRLPIGLEFSPDRSLLAIVYKGLPILIWDIEDEAPLGTCDRLSRFGSRRASMHLLVIAMVFNPAMKQLAAAYGDGDIAVFDYESQEVLVSVEADAQALACSPNGFTLATGDAFGTIQLRDFETLELLYTLSAYDDPIHALVFSPDSLRFLDIRGSKCNLWEPAVLVREVDDDDDQSMSGTAISEGPFQPQESKVSTAHDIVLVTALACHSDGNTIFVAKDDGSVSTYDAQTGKRIKVLYSHSNESDISVTRLAWGSRRGILSSADVSTRLKTWQLSQDPRGIWDTKVQLLDIYLSSSITQILLNPENNLIMVSTTTSDSIYTLGGDLTQSRVSSAPKTWKWINHPSDPKWVISISPSSAHVYSWSDFTEICAHTLAILPTSPKANLTIRTLIPIPKSHLAVEVLESSPNFSRTHLQLFSSSSFKPPGLSADEPVPTVSSEPTIIQPIPSTNFLSTCLERLIALSTPSTLVFLDTNLWVCTIDLRTFTGKDYTRHFFLPYDWLSASGHGLLMDVVGRWDVACVKGDEVAVVRKGIRGEGEGKVDL
jgi:WD40 repeat protein